MALNTFKCDYLTPLHFKGLSAREDHVDITGIDKAWC